MTEQAVPDSEGASSDKPKKKRRWWIWGIVGLIVAGCFCTLVVGLIGDDDGVDEPPAATEIAQADNPTEAQPTDTMDPSTTPSPAPTSTPAPTDTPLPPTATPEPVVIEGAGQDVTDEVTVPSSVNLAHFTHTGSSNFAVFAFAPDGSEQLLINEIGTYDGVRPLFGAGDWYFEVDANGQWTIEIEAIRFEQEAIDMFTGQGDNASGLFNPPEGGNVTYEFEHDGTSNFVVYIHCGGGTSLLQNEIGAVSNAAVVRFTEGPCMWEVEADGSWSIAPRE